MVQARAIWYMVQADVAWYMVQTRALCLAALLQQAFFMRADVRTYWTLF